MKPALIDQIDDASTVERIAGKPIGMPGDDAISLARFDAVEHFIEDRPSFCHGALTFGELLNDIELPLTDKLADFGKLIADASHLAIFLAGRFSDVDEVSVFHDLCG